MTSDAVQALSAAVAAAGPELLRVGSPRFTAPASVGSLGVDAALDLGEGRWLGVVSDSSGSRWTVPLIVEEGVEKGVDVGVAVRRARPGDGVAEALVHVISEGGSTPEPFALTRWYSRTARGERAVGVDQTNESVVVGEAAVVKWSTHLPPRGVAVAHPASSRIATLAREAFRSTPRPWAWLVVHVPGEPPLLVGTVAEFLPGATDGWTWAVDGVLALAAGEVTLDASLTPAVELGRLTSDLHVALASAGVDIATDDDVRRLHARAHADLQRALAVVDGPEGERLHAVEAVVSGALDGLARLVGTPLIDVHGDLHVGQVLRHGDPPEYGVIDFDGNPVLPFAERSGRAPAALDVASMAASLDHVGRVVLRRLERDGDASRDAAGRVRTWIRLSQKAFLDAYHLTLDARGRGELFDERALLPFRFQQECREFLYANDHLPHWRYVPDGALPDLVAQLHATD